MSDKLRIGIISANWGVAAHLPAWRANPDIEVVGICTAHQHTAEAAANANSIPLPFWDYREMVQHPDIDIVDAGTRPNLRYDMCLAALRAGKHVYNGVPFTDSLEHARDLYDTYKASGRVAAVDAYSEYMPAIVFAKELIDDDAVGELYSLTCTLQMSLFNAQVSTFPYNWFWERSAGCSALRNLGSHALNVLYYLFGEIDEVVAEDETCLKEWKFVDNHETLRPQVEDTANVLLRFKSGGVGVMAPAWCAIAGRGFLLDTFGSKGRLVLEGPGLPSNQTRVHYAKLEELSARELTVPSRLRRREGIGLTAYAEGDAFGGGPQFAMALVYADMIRAIREGGEARPSFSQAFHTHAAIEAAHRSAAERSWVSVRELTEHR